MIITSLSIHQKRMYKLYTADIVKWAKDYNGQLFHGLLSDPPYNLDSITKRFGSQGAAPSKFGSDGAFQRSSQGFLSQDWDTDIACQVDTWEAIKTLLHPGAFCIAYSSARTFHRMATAIENAGFVIHPMIGWCRAQGLPKPTRLDLRLDALEGIKRKSADRKPAVTRMAKIWEGHRYGRQVLRPCFEPICVFQKPYENSALDSIVKTGAGALWTEGARIAGDSVPINVLETWSGLSQKVKPKYKKTINDKGRWPTNLVVDAGVGDPYEKYFYVVKPTKTEKYAGLEYDENDHPTVKPINLNKKLATLLLPPETYKPRRLLVPFSGVASEMIAALLIGWDEVIGIELKYEYNIIANKRLKEWVHVQ